MSRRVDLLSQAHTDLGQVLEKMTVDPDGQARRIARVDLAAEHIEAWAEGQAPAWGVRGGSSSPRETEDRREQEALARQVLADDAELREVPKEIARLALRLHRLVARNVELVRADRLPVDEPECRSCARSEGKGAARIGGHRGVAVRQDVPGHGLCDNCYRAALSAKNEAGAAQILPVHWPPVRYCDLLHEQGPRAAGLWLARQRAA